jgi:RNA polymerase sigma factor (sigma-70 family)
MIKTIELVKKAQSGDSNAFEELYTLKLRTILYHIHSLTKSPNDVEDIAQEVGIRLFTKLPNLKAPEAFNVWMQRIITNTCYDHDHHTQKNGKGLTHANIDDYTNIVEEENKEFLPGEYAEAEDLRRLVLDTVSKLPLQRKRVIIMYYFDDMAYKEIAEALRITTSTVSTSIMKAKKMIKRELEKKTGTKADIIPNLSAVTVMGKVMEIDSLRLYPQSRIESIAHSVRSAIDDGVVMVGNSAATSHAEAAKTISVKLIVSVVVAVAVITGGIAAVVHEAATKGDSKPASVDLGIDQAQGSAATDKPAPAKSDLEVIFTGSECDCGHLNPEKARMGGTPAPGSVTVWEITRSGSEDSIASGEGEEVTAPLKALYEDKDDGQYKLTFTNTAESGHRIIVKRNFVIDTGDILLKNYR